MSNKQAQALVMAVGGGASLVGGLVGLAISLSSDSSYSLLSAFSLPFVIAGVLRLWRAESLVKE